MKKQVKTESTAKTKRAFARLLSNELPLEVNGVAKEQSMKSM